MAQQTARYPAFVATDADLKIARNRLQTSLRAPAGAFDSLILVSDPIGIQPYMLLSIDTEIMNVIAVAGNYVSVTRGFDGTLPQPHTNGALVSAYVDAWHHNQLSAEVQAIEATLGPNLSNIPGGSGATGWILPGPYNFTPQTPGGNLTANIINSVTLTPVPIGLNATDVRHWLRITGGTGAEEVVQIAGGNAVSGAPSGTILFTPKNNHTGAWVIQSATNGIQEALYSTPPRVNLFLPAGDYHLYAEVYVAPTIQPAINGAGINLTMIYIWQNTGYGFYFEANTTNALNFGLMTIKKAGVWGTSEVFVGFHNWSPGILVHDINTVGAFCAIELDSSQVDMTNLYIADCADTGIRGKGSRMGGSMRNVQVVNWDNVGQDGTVQGQYAVKFQGVVDGFYCSGCSFGGNAQIAKGYLYGVYINPLDQYASNIFFDHCIFDSLKIAGFLYQVDQTASPGGGIIVFDSCRFGGNGVANSNVGLQFITQNAGGLPKIEDITITGSFIAGFIYGILLAGVANTAVAGNVFQGIDKDGFAPQVGILISSATYGTVNKNLSITGNTIGPGHYGAMTRVTQSQNVGGPLETAIQVDLNHQNVTIAGNVLRSINQPPVFLQGIPNGFVFEGNDGVDDMTASIGAAATLALTEYRHYVVTGNTPVAAVTGLWAGRTGTLITPDGAVTFTASASIGNTITTLQNRLYQWWTDGTKLYIGG